MSLLRRCVLLLLCGLVAVPVSAQERGATADGVEALDGSVLSAVTLMYETEVKMGRRSTTRPTVRTLSTGTRGGQSIWRVVDAVQRATQADTLFLDRATLRPLGRRVGGRFALTLRFDSLSVAGSLRAQGQMRTVERTFEQPVLGSTANMEVGLATLPLEPGYAVQFLVFHAQLAEVTPTTLRVVGTKTVDVPAGSFEVYVLETTAKGNGPSGTYYVRRAAPHHVLRAELQVPGPRGGTVTATKRLTAMTKDTATGSE